MLKWLVTGREGGEAVADPINISQTRSISVNNTDDPLAAAVGSNSDNNNYNLYKVNRVNPIFRETEVEGSDHQDAPNVGRAHHQAREQTSDVKKPGYYFPESYSSGYWSFNEGGGVTVNGLHHMSGLLAPGTELESCFNPEAKEDNKRSDARELDIPGPVWPGSSNWNLRGEIAKDRNSAVQSGGYRDQNAGSASGPGDRCFEIRHQRVVPNVPAPRPGKGEGEKSRTTSRDFHNAGQKSAQALAIRILRESDHEEHNGSDGDSLEELSDDGEEGSDRMNDKSKEDMDRVIAELTSALIQSKGVSALTNALGKNTDSTVTNPGPGLRKTSNPRGPTTQMRAGSRNINTSSEKNNNNNSHSKKSYLKTIKERRSKSGVDNPAYSSEDTVDTFGSSTDSRKHLRPLKYQNIHPAFISQLGGVKSTRKYFSDPRHSDSEKYYRRPKEINRADKYRIRKAEHYYEDQQNISFPPSGSWQLSRKPLRPGPLSLGAELDYKNFNYNYGMFVTEELYGRTSHMPRDHPYDVYRKKKERKHCKSCIKFFCLIILLVSFLLVIVCVSVFIIKDKPNT